MIACTNARSKQSYNGGGGAGWKTKGRLHALTDQMLTRPLQAVDVARAESKLGHSAGHRLGRRHARAISQKRVCRFVEALIGRLDEQADHPSTTSATLSSIPFRGTPVYKI